ncbi:serine/threonine-protein kinase [Nocardia crassostreae]|uniref:serine/threonine-protein kinase n=1 Tax=Nocardia crassostreae TaxID=53428 RepID=UPI000833B3A2|nr:serine/threonine-protein kinase [Nocardia crassostreae]
MDQDLTTAVTRFAEAWEKADAPPDLAAYLPISPDLRRICLIELIKVDLHYRWRRGAAPKRLAGYLADFPELVAEPLPPDLLYEEFHCVRAYGAATDPTRVSGDAEDVADSYRSTLIVPPRAHHELAAIDVGDRIDDLDLLLGLGSGAFGRVYLARQRSMERLVALKISYNHGREPQLLAQLDQQFIVRVFDQRLLANRDLKLMYMEYVPGGTLRDLSHRVAATPPEQRSGRTLIGSVDEHLGERGVRPGESGTRDRIAALSWPETVAWLGRRLAEALEHAARHGVLHRDIKPANVLLTAEGIPKLADFNIGFSDHVPGTGPAAYFGGSLAYMSPEQLAACHPYLPERAEDLDERSDLYALGVLLWELLTGRRPFDDEANAGISAASVDRMLTVRRHGVGPERLADLPADCPATLRRVLLTCLAPDPGGRWASGAELAQQLEVCLDARARDLVDPPSHSWRARLDLRPIPVATFAVIAAQLCAVLYLLGHNVTLLNVHIPAEGKPAYWTTSAIVAIALHLGCGAAILVACRYVLTVPWGIRKGRRYDAATLARARADTLACGRRIGWIMVAGWEIALALLGSAILVMADPPVGVFVNLVGSHFMTGVIAATAPFFLITFHVVRWYYPALLLYGTRTAADAEQLRRLARRCERVLAMAAWVPLVTIGVGLVFLDPIDLHSIAGSVVWLCAGSVAAFALAFTLFRAIRADLAALTRVVNAAVLDQPVAGD